MVWGALMATALASAPTPFSLTSDEQASLAKGEIVVRPAPGGKGEMMGVVDIQAPFDPIWDAVFDWQARKESVGAIEDITVYAPMTDPKGLGVTFELSVLGTEVVYHLRYKADRDGGWTSFTLDPEREHDIVATNGSYLVTPIDGGHRVYYRAFTDTGRWVPGFIRNSFAVGQIKDQLEEMRTRASKK